MPVHLVTYDLHDPGKNYPSILAAIKASASWAKLSESSYAIFTSETASQAYRRIHSNADQNDTMYVIALDPYWDGRGPKAVNDWLQQYLGA